MTKRCWNQSAHRRVAVTLISLAIMGGFCLAQAEREGQGTYLTLHREAYQGAFTLLIPRGWRAEGGMVGSGVPGNVVDLVESNIRFRVTSPDGQSFFGWYPRFYFQDPRSHPGAGMGMGVQYGSVLNGCWQYPYMTIPQYVQTVIFGALSAQEFQNPRIIGPVVESPELRPFVPAVATHSQCGYVNFECTIAGTPRVGRIYTILYNLGGNIWSTVGTFGWVAPTRRWRQDARVMDLCLRTFRLDPQWVVRAADAAARRGQQYNEIIRQLNEADRQMERQRSQTRSDIQTEVYKVLTGQMEALDPQTGRQTWLPMYQKAYTDGQGNYFLTDVEGPLPIDNDPSWRRLQIVNRNDPNYREK